MVSELVIGFGEQDYCCVAKSQDGGELCTTFGRKGKSRSRLIPEFLNFLNPRNQMALEFFRNSSRILVPYPFLATFWSEKLRHTYQIKLYLSPLSTYSFGCILFLIFFKHNNSSAATVRSISVLSLDKENPMLDYDKKKSWSSPCCWQWKMVPISKQEALHFTVFSKNSRNLNLRIFERRNQIVKWFNKDQLILKCLFGVFNSPKKTTKTIRLEGP